MSIKKNLRITWATLLVFSIFCVFLLYYTPVEKTQGAVYRILYIHVPFAFSSFLLSFILFILSLKALLKPNPKTTLAYMQSSCEIGLLFTTLTLLTGSLWGKPTWGTFWTWDARLTTTFILWILFTGFLFLIHTIEDLTTKLKTCAVLGIFIFFDIPVIYKSVTWWRTLHQQPSLLRPGGPSMSAEIFWPLAFSIFLVSMLGLWIFILRAENIILENDVELLLMEQEHVS
jgi:heme exporter protein C